MKKILFSLGALAFAFHSHAQEIVTDNEVDDISWGQAKSKPHLNPRHINNGPESTPLWTEDFGNGMPAGWVVDDASNINPWKYSLVGSAGFFNGNQGTAGTNPIQSTSAANGFLISDPDSANHHTYGQPSGANYVYCNSYIYTTKIDLGATYSSLVLDFQQFFRFNNSVNLVVRVSSDSINWTDINVQGITSNNTTSSNPVLFSIPLSAATGPTQNVYLAFGWDARVYYWMIDDLVISESPNHGMALTSFQGAPPTDIIYRPNQAAPDGNAKYGTMALKQSREIQFDANAFNIGQQAQTNVRLEVDVYDNTSNLVTSLTSPTTPLFSPLDTLDFSSLTTNSWLPNVEGTFTAVYRMLSDSINGANSYPVPTDSLTFFVTDTLLGPDFGQIDNLIGTNATFGEDACAFMPRMDLVSDEYVYGVWVWLSANTVPGGSVEAYVRDTAGFSFTTGFVANPIAVGTHTVTQADVDNNFMYIPLTDAQGNPLFLQEGSYFTEVVLFSNALNNPIILGNDQTVDQPGLSTLYFTTRAGITPRYFARFTGSRTYASPLIRLVTCSSTDTVCGPKTSGISVDNLTQSNLVNVFPNPASDKLFLESTIEGAVSIYLINGNGQQLLNKEMNFDGSRQHIDVSSLAKGLYFLQITQQDGSFTTHKILVQ